MQGRQIVLRKPYRMVGESVRENDAEAFAAAMSRLVADLSAALQQDLCAVAIANQAQRTGPTSP
jgi:hypothetical protein